MTKYPGAQCIRQLLRLKELIEKGGYVPPIPGIIKGKENFPFILSSSDDIVVEGSENGYPFVFIKQGERKFLVAIEEANELRVGKDDKGRSIFLSLPDS